MDLSKARNTIDDIDQKILSLFLERMDLAREIGAYKEQQDLPVLNKTREREILTRIQEASGDMELYSHRLFSTLMDLSRAYQEELSSSPSPIRSLIEKSLLAGNTPFPQKGTVACQGIEGSYSQQAADRMFPRGNILFFKTFDAVFDAVESGLCDFGILPVENSSNGSVRAVYDLLQRKKAFILRSERLWIRHELLAKPGTKLSDIRKIYSHEQAIGQCGDFIKSLGSEVEIIPVTNTAVAARLAAESGDASAASISSHGCDDLYGLVSLGVKIQNSDNNYTRFICIAKEPRIYPGANRISLILSCEHRPGALHEILSRLSALEINLLKLESYPIVGRDFEFMFFFDFEAEASDPKVLGMLESLERISEQFIYLGNYAEV